MRTLQAYFASLHRKLIAAMTAAIVTALALAASALFVAEALNTRRPVTNELQSLAQAIGAETASALHLRAQLGDV